MGGALDMEDENPDVLRARLASYREQLEQIDSVLLADPNNETLAKLRLDIVQVIELTEELLKVTVGGGDDEGALEKDLLKDYEAGDIVLAFFEKETNWQAAEIDAVTSDGNFAITWLGYPSSSAEVGPEKIKAFEHISLMTGDKCQAIYSGDSLWYDATVGSVDPDGYEVTYDKFGNTERVKSTHVRIKSVTEWHKEDKKRKLQIREVPENLKILPTDTDSVKQQKKKKIKSIKSHNRSVEKDLVQNKRQNAWQSFQAKGAKKKVIGKFVGRQRESMFKTPEGDVGKVGVVGSGRGMTDFVEFENRVRHRAGMGNDDDDE